VLLSDVEVVPAKDHHRPSHEDASAPFDLDACLTALVGLTAAKSELRSMRNRLEVGRKREVFGVKDRKPPHLFLVGSLGMNFRSFADAVAGMLSDLQVLRTSNVVEVSKEDLVASGSEATAKLAMAAAEKALGGVLLVRDASSLVSSGEGGNSNDRQSEFYGQMAVTSLLKVVGDAHAAGKAPPLVLVFCVRREGEQALLRAAPALATLVPTKIELAEYSLPETALLVRRTVEAQNFKLSAALDDDALVEILKPVRVLGCLCAPPRAARSPPPFPLLPRNTAPRPVPRRQARGGPGQDPRRSRRQPPDRPRVRLENRLQGVPALLDQRRL